MFKSHGFKPRTKINPNKLDEVEKQANNSGTLTEKLVYLLAYKTN